MQEVAARQKGHVPIGSSQWIQKEREQIAVYQDQEMEDFTFSTRNEFDWLNEHMAEIFSQNKLNLAEIFKTPGKLRGKTPRTARRNPLEARAPLTDIFATDRRFNASPSRPTGPPEGELQLAQKQLPEPSLEEQLSDAVKQNIGKQNTDSGYHGMTEDDMDTTSDTVHHQEPPKHAVMQEEQVVSNVIMDTEQFSDEARTTEGSFHSARENVTVKDVQQPLVDFQVGDTVEVPGGVDGVLMYLGEVKGKDGLFAGVELSEKWASKGRHDGSAGGHRYFTTSKPGAGIFLPLNRILRRISRAISSVSVPPSPSGSKTDGIPGAFPVETTVLPDHVHKPALLTGAADAMEVEKSVDVVEAVKTHDTERDNDAMEVDDTNVLNEDNRDLEASTLSSEGSTPDKPLVRKSSLTFAALPAREPLTTKRSIGNRVSRTSNLDASKPNTLNRGSYLGRYTGGKSLGTSRLAQDEHMDVDEPTRPAFSREESDGDGKISRLHNKSSTQRLHERINLLGKTQPPRPTKSITTTAVTVQASYAELSRASAEPSAVKEQEIVKSAVVNTMKAVDDDEEDWIKPPVPQLQTAGRPQLAKSRSVDVMERISGKESIGGDQFGMGAMEREQAKQKSPLRQETVSESSSQGRGLKKSISTTALVSPSKPIPSMEHTEPQRPLSVPEHMFPPTGSTTPMGSPVRSQVEGHLSASKNKLQSIMKSARGLFTKSAGVSAQARMEALSPPPTRMQDFQPLSGIAETTMEPSVNSKSLYPTLPNKSEPSLFEGRKTRSSTEKEEKRKDQEAKDRQRAEAELAKAREQERQKAKDYKEKMDQATSKAKPKNKLIEATLETTSKPIRQSPRRQAKEAPSQSTESKASQNMPPPSRAETQQILHGQKSKEVRRPVKPSAKPKPPQVSIRVGTMSQRIPLTTGALSSSLQDTLAPASQKQQVPTKKASNASLQTTASNNSLKSSVSSNSAKPRSLIIAAQKKEQAEKEAQRKDEDKRERERRRVAAQEEAQRKEQKQREEIEKRKERERAAIEQTKKDAQKQQERKRLLEAKKTQQQEHQRAAKEVADALHKDKSQQSMNDHRQGAGTNKSQPRMDKLSEYPKNHPGANSAKAPIKRVFDPDHDDELSRPAWPQAGQNYQQTDGKRRRTGDEETYEAPTRPTMAPPIRQSNIRKPQNTGNYNQQGYGHKPQESLKSSMMNGNYPTAPPAASGHASGPSHFKSTATAQAYQQYQYNGQTQYNNQAQYNHHMSRPANPMDMAQYTNGKIPFAEAPNPPQTAYKTPLTSKQAQQPSTTKSSPMYTNGDNIHLDDIPTDSEEEDSEDERERKRNIPEWARTPNLFEQLGEQEGLDADAVFGPIGPLNLEEMFKDKSKYHRYRSRTSSANWAGSDRLTEEEIKKDIEARKKVKENGGWSYGISRE